jgi:hypothetical protein
MNNSIRDFFLLISNEKLQIEDLIDIMYFEEK